MKYIQNSIALRHDHVMINDNYHYHYPYHYHYYSYSCSILQNSDKNLSHKQQLQPRCTFTVEEHGIIVETCNKAGRERYCVDCGVLTGVFCSTHDPEQCNDCAPELDVIKL